MIHSYTDDELDSIVRLSIDGENYPKPKGG
jgi:hypothetical protein